jgi:hypothetical protein
VLEKELAHLRAQIGRVRQEQEKLERELRAGEAELERLSADRQRIDALQDVCNALDRLRELNADALFWDGIAGADGTALHLERARSRIARFQRETGRILEEQAARKERIDRCLDELALLQEDVQDAYERDARREEEYVIEREISPVPVLPRSGEAGSERSFRKAVLVALLLAAVLGTLIPLLNVPAPVRPAVVVVPERLVSMLRKEPKPAPPKEEQKPEQAQEEKEREIKAREEKAPQEDRAEQASPEAQAARRKAESTGVLAFRESLKGLIDEAPAARLGAAARLREQPAAAGPARAGRALVALPPAAAGFSGGIGNSGINRSIGPGAGERIAAVDTVKVESRFARLSEEARPVGAAPGGGSGPVRTDEEIQIVFDKYKSALYRLYNIELRRNPALRGRIILRIVIEPGGEVSACTVQSNDLQSPELVAQIVARIRKFNFGPKEGVSRLTILYPIDFLPGG